MPRKKPELETCSCGEGPVREGWPCCEECRAEHFGWPLPAEIIRRGGAVVDWGDVQASMTGSEDPPRILIRVSTDEKKHPGELLFAWRRLGKTRWTSLGSSDEASYSSFPEEVDRTAYHWWSQTLTGIIDELIDLDPYGL